LHRVCDRIVCLYVQLLTPAERREILEYERRQRVAHEIIREAVAQREKTRKLVTGQSFHRGIVGVDAAHNETSEIYGKQAVAVRAHEEYKSITHLERHANIAAKTSSLETNGDYLVPETIASRVQIEKLYQSKGGQNMVGLSFDETFNRIFNRRMDRPPKTIRTLHMRDQELSGKQYNLVNHTLIEHWPARQFFERDVDKRMHHPSQFCAPEGPRNLQGTLQADKKF
jgi:Trp operon repressor